MTNILKIDEWVDLQNCKHQFFFIDPEDKSVAERLKDDFVFFIGDEVCYFAKTVKNFIRVRIQSFDDVSMALVHMNNGHIVQINKIEKTECFNTVNTL